MSITREEEIEKALNFYAPSYWDDISRVMSYRELTASYCGFRKGAKWADENPKSPWISVEDRLPTGGGHYLCMDDNHNIAVLAFVGDKWINTKTFTDVPLEVVIYWMPIPELPKNRR